MKLKLLLSAASIVAIVSCMGSDDQWNDFVRKNFSKVDKEHICDKKGNKLTLRNSEVSLKSSFESAYLLTQLGREAAQREFSLYVIKTKAKLSDLEEKLGWLIFAAAYNVFKTKKPVEYENVLQYIDVDDKQKDEFQKDANIYLNKLGLLEYINSYATNSNDAKYSAQLTEDLCQVWDNKTLNDIITEELDDDNSNLGDKFNGLQNALKRIDENSYADDNYIKYSAQPAEETSQIYDNETSNDVIKDELDGDNSNLGDEFNDHQNELKRIDENSYADNNDIKYSAQPAEEMSQIYDNETSNDVVKDELDGDNSNLGDEFNDHQNTLKRVEESTKIEEQNYPVYFDAVETKIKEKLEQLKNKLSETLAEERKKLFIAKYLPDNVSGNPFEEIRDKKTEDGTFEFSEYEEDKFQRTQFKFYFYGLIANMYNKLLEDGPISEANRDIKDFIQEMMNGNHLDEDFYKLRSLEDEIWDESDNSDIISCFDSAKPNKQKKLSGQPCYSFTKPLRRYTYTEFYYKFFERAQEYDDIRVIAKNTGDDLANKEKQRYITYFKKLKNGLRSTARDALYNIYCRLENHDKLITELLKKDMEKVSKQEIEKYDEQKSLLEIPLKICNIFKWIDLGSQSALKDKNDVQKLITKLSELLEKWSLKDEIWYEFVPISGPGKLNEKEKLSESDYTFSKIIKNFIKTTKEYIDILNRKATENDVHNVQQKSQDFETPIAKKYTPEEIVGGKITGPDQLLDVELKEREGVAVAQASDAYARMLSRYIDLNRRGKLQGRNYHKFSEIVESFIKKANKYNEILAKKKKMGEDTYDVHLKYRKYFHFFYGKIERAIYELPSKVYAEHIDIFNKIFEISYIMTDAFCKFCSYPADSGIRKKMLKLEKIEALVSELRQLRSKKELWDKEFDLLMVHRRPHPSHKDFRGISFEESKLKLKFTEFVDESIKIFERFIEKCNRDPSSVYSSWYEDKIVIDCFAYAYHLNFIYLEEVITKYKDTKDKDKKDKDTKDKGKEKATYWILKKEYPFPIVSPAYRVDYASNSEINSKYQEQCTPLKMIQDIIKTFLSWKHIEKSSIEKLRELSKKWSLKNETWNEFGSELDPYFCSGQSNDLGQLSDLDYLKSVTEMQISFTKERMLYLNTIDQQNEILRDIFHKQTKYLEYFDDFNRKINSTSLQKGKQYELSQSAINQETEKYKEQIAPLEIASKICDLFKKINPTSWSDSKSKEYIKNSINELCKSLEKCSSKGEISDDFIKNIKNINILDDKEITGDFAHKEYLAYFDDLNKKIEDRLGILLWELIETSGRIEDEYTNDKKNILEIAQKICTLFKNFKKINPTSWSDSKSEEYIKNSINELRKLLGECSSKDEILDEFVPVSGQSESDYTFSKVIENFIETTKEYSEILTRKEAVLKKIYNMQQEFLMYIYSSSEKASEFLAKGGFKFDEKISEAIATTDSRRFLGYDNKSIKFRVYENQQSEQVENSSCNESDENSEKPNQEALKQKESDENSEKPNQEALKQKESDENSEKPNQEKIAAIVSCMGSDDQWNDFVRKKIFKVDKEHIWDENRKELILRNSEVSLKSSFESAYLLTQLGREAAQREFSLYVIKAKAKLSDLEEKLGWLIFAAAYNVFKTKKPVEYENVLQYIDVDDKQKDEFQKDANIYLNKLGLLEYINSYATNSNDAKYSNQSTERLCQVWDNKTLNNIITDELDDDNSNLGDKFNDLQNELKRIDEKYAIHGFALKTYESYYKTESYYENNEASNQETLKKVKVPFAGENLFRRNTYENNEALSEFFLHCGYFEELKAPIRVSLDICNTLIDALNLSADSAELNDKKTELNDEKALSASGSNFSELIKTFIKMIEEYSEEYEKNYKHYYPKEPENLVHYREMFEMLNMVINEFIARDGCELFKKTLQTGDVPNLLNTLRNLCKKNKDALENVLDSTLIDILTPFSDSTSGSNFSELIETFINKAISYYEYFSDLNAEQVKFGGLRTERKHKQALVDFWLLNEKINKLLANEEDKKLLEQTLNKEELKEKLKRIIEHIKEACEQKKLLLENVLGICDTLIKADSNAPVSDKSGNEEKLSAFVEKFIRTTERFDENLFREKIPGVGSSFNGRRFYKEKNEDLNNMRIEINSILEKGGHQLLKNSRFKEKLNEIEKIKKTYVKKKAQLENTLTKACNIFKVSLDSPLKMLRQIMNYLKTSYNSQKNIMTFRVRDKNNEQINSLENHLAIFGSVSDHRKIMKKSLEEFKQVMDRINVMYAEQIAPLKIASEIYNILKRAKLDSQFDSNTKNNVQELINKLRELKNWSLKDNMYYFYIVSISDSGQLIKKEQLSEHGCYKFSEIIENFIKVVEKYNETIEKKQDTENGCNYKEDYLKYFDDFNEIIEKELKLRKNYFDVKSIAFKNAYDERWQTFIEDLINNLSEEQILLVASKFMTESKRWIIMYREEEEKKHIERLDDSRDFFGYSGWLFY